MGRPLGEAWMNSVQAGEELGISPRQLRKLRSQMKAGIHYRVKNPRSARPEYLWNVEKVKLLLIPESIPNKN